MTESGFVPAGSDETVVFGSPRPGYPSTTVAGSVVNEWLSAARRRGIHRVCCLLLPEQLAYYQVDLLATYRDAFGPSNVRWAEVRDYHLCDHATLERLILPFLHESARATTPVVLHCSGGTGRTGHVLAAWLVRHRGMTVDEALATVKNTGRNPWEAVQHGYATEKELRCLVAGGL